jgi:hypothetical protein
LTLVNAAIDSGSDPRQLARQIVDYLRALLLVKLGNAALVDATAENRALMARQAEGWTPPELLRAIRIFNTAANDAKGGWQLQLPLELAVVECTTPPEEPVGPSPDQRRPVLAVRPASAPALTAAVVSVGGDLRSAWLRTLDLLLERRKIQKLTKVDLEQCLIDGLDGNVLLISAGKGFLERLRSRPEFVGTVSSALSEVLGAPHTVRFQLTEGHAGRPADPRADVPAEGIVATALRDLGGEIVEE